MSSVFRFDESELDSRTGTLRHGGEAVRVDARVLRLLEAFVRNPGQLICKDKLIDQVWGGAVSDNALTVTLSRLRRLFREHGMPGESLLTEYGHGYRFTRRVSASEGKGAPTAVAQLLRPEFIGRKREMLQLMAALSAAQSGRGSLVALRGEPGIGKTLLAEVFAELAVRAGCEVAWGCCHELGETPPLWPFVEMLRTVTKQSRATLPPGLLSSAGALDLASQLHNLGSKHQMFDAIAHTLTVAAATTPQLDADTREVLTYAAVIGSVFSLPLLASVTGQRQRR